MCPAWPTPFHWLWVTYSAGLSSLYAPWGPFLRCLSIIILLTHWLAQITVLLFSAARVFLEFCSSFIAFENCRVILLLLYTTHTSNRERSHLSRLVPAFVFRQYRARLVFRSRVDSLPSNLGSILLLLYTTYTFNIGLNGASFASHCACLAQIKMEFWHAIASYFFLIFNS